VRIACLAVSRIPSRSANSIRVMKVAQALVRLGHEVDLWYPGRRPAPPWADLRRHYGLSVEFRLHPTPGLSGLRRWDTSLRAVVESSRRAPDLFYVWSYQAAAALSVLGRPTLFEIHDRPAGAFGPLLFRLFLRGGGARRLLVITDALRAWLATRYGAPLREPFVVITPSGVDLEPYDDLPEPEEARRRLGWPQRLTVSYTGHLYPGRGLDLLTELARRNPEVAFVWAGGESNAVDAWRRRLADQRIANVRLLGFVPQVDLPLIHAASDVLVMPYEHAIAVSSGGDTSAFASPMKAFEYLAAGRALLSSDLPVLREVLDDENAILLPPQAVDAWDAALRRVASDPEQRARLGRRARQEARRYSWLERTRRAIEGLGPRADGERGR